MAIFLAVSSSLTQIFDAARLVFLIAEAVKLFLTNVDGELLLFWDIFALANVSENNGEENANIDAEASGINEMRLGKFILLSLFLSGMF